MSLVKKKSSEAPREALKTESEILEQQKVQKRIYEKEQRKKHLDHWNEQKAIVDALSVDELLNYIESSNANDARVGLHGMKINAQEHAIIKLALSICGARSTRDLFVNLCKDVIKKGK